MQIKMLIELQSGQAVHTSLLADIKEDLRTHIKRSHQNEVAIQYLKKRQYIAEGALADFPIIYILLKVSGIIS